LEATKIVSDFEVNFARCSVFEEETTTVDIYVYMQGQRRGPYEKVQLEAMWKRGQIPVDTLYWHDGMSKWAVISDLFAGDKTIAPSLPEDAPNAGTTIFPASL
jgi:GYF domain 2